MPDKSSFPSAVRGAGTVGFGLPSSVRGTLGSRGFAHWAGAGEAMRRRIRVLKRFTPLGSPVCIRGEGHRVSKSPRSDGFQEAEERRSRARLSQRRVTYLLL